jgi:catechol 2,3-dioxygenase-like lactoylglutathione lyase family enzyme
MRLHHVSIPAPPDQIENGRTFYGEVLGLNEIPQPDSLGAGAVIWFEAGDGELHLFKEENPNSQPSGRHFCFAVDDVESIRARLEQAGIQTEDTTPIPNRPRFFCQDPFGNRLEITSILGSYR